MTGILGKFYVEQGSRGSRVMARSNQLSDWCGSDEEIDTSIQQLKDDLDACAREMKRLGAINRRSSLFEVGPLPPLPTMTPYSRGSQLAGHRGTRFPVRGRVQHYG
jgi:hypothetical protein